MADVTMTIDVNGNAEERADAIGGACDRAAVQAEGLAARLETLPDAKVKADISNLEYKIEIAKEKLRSASGTYEAKLKADIGEMETKLAIAKGEMMSFKNESESGFASMATGWQGIALAIAAASSELIGIGAVGATALGVIMIGSRGVSDAITLLGQESAQTGMMIDSALGQKVSEAFGKLTKGGQDFAIEVNQLNQGPLRELENAAQNGLFEGLALGLKESEQPLRNLVPLVGDFSNRLGQMAVDIAPEVAHLLESFVRFADQSLAALQRAGLDKALGDIAEGLAQMFEDMVNSGEAANAMHSLVQILEVSAKVLPGVIELIANLSSLMTTAYAPTMALATAVEYLLKFLNSLLSIPSTIVNWVFGTAESAGGVSGAAVGAPMASGGVVTSPGYHLLGDGGQPEAVIPLSQLSAMLGGPAGGGGGGGPVYNINVSGVVGSPSAVTTAVRRALKTTSGRGYGVGFA